MTDFSKFKIKGYKYWSIFIHQNQSYLGRCIVWCDREDVTDLTEATLEEQQELFFILQELRGALQKAFNPDWFNYAFLGNDTRHLHAHVVPRYATSKEYEGVVFKDTLYGHNYKTDHSFSVSEKVLDSIRLRIKEKLG